MMLLHSLRNRFWQWIALWACKQADRSYETFLKRYDPNHRPKVPSRNPVPIRHPKPKRTKASVGKVF